MRKELYNALMDYADDPTLSNRMRLYHEIQQERIDAEPDEDVQLAEIADKLEDKPVHPHDGHYF